MTITDAAVRQATATCAYWEAECAEPGDTASEVLVAKTEEECVAYVTASNLEAAYECGEQDATFDRCGWAECAERVEEDPDASGGSCHLAYYFPGCDLRVY